MDTLLKNPPIVPEPEDAPDRPERRGISRGDVLSKFSLSSDGLSQVDIPRSDPQTNPLPTPERIIVRKLTLAFGPTGPFAYSNPDRYHPCTKFGDVADMIDRIMADNYDPQAEAAPYFRPLDLHLGATTCFIIRLDKDISWRFGRTLKGATLGQGKFDFPDDVKNYYDLRHVWKDETTMQTYDELDQCTEHSQYCRLIYFIAKPVVGRGFNHAFNLNVEFVYPDGAAGEINTLPIVIDPDVRYPGGSGGN